MKRIFSLFNRKPKVEVITFSRKAVKEREHVHKTCAKLAAELHYSLPEVLR